MNSTPNGDDSVDDVNTDDVNTDELSYYCLNALKRAISVQRMTYFLSVDSGELCML